MAYNNVLETLPAGQQILTKVWVPGKLIAFTADLGPSPNDIFLLLGYSHISSNPELSTGLFCSPTEEISALSKANRVYVPVPLEMLEVSHRGQFYSVYIASAQAINIPILFTYEVP